MRGWGSVDRDNRRVAETKPKSRKKKQEDSSYWASTHRPLQCLMFLLPLVVLYEVGVILYATEFVPGQGRLPIHIVARTMLVEFFSRLNLQIPGLYLPGLILIIVLFTWHIARKDPWRIEPKLYGWMFIESAGLALPIFTIHLAVFYMVMAFQEQIDPAQLSLLAGTASDDQTGWQRGMVWSVGAGIYEELLFRLIGVSLLYFLFIKIIEMTNLVGTILAIGICAILFAFYHFPSREPFSLQTFLIFIVVGVAGMGLLYLLFVKLIGMQNSAGTALAIGICAILFTIYHIPSRESFDLPTFLFFTAAGSYLGVVYLSRGFGIAVTTHALYDVMVVLMTYQTQS
jgi:membrane protease YdiL (CAAX protease family)